jgi:NAD-dependent DNA ligase
MTQTTPQPVVVTVAARVAELTELLRRNADLYYNHDGAAELTDDAYDALIEELEAIEAAQPELAAEDSPAVTVGAPADGRLFSKVRHQHPMLSLRKATTPEAGHHPRSRSPRSWPTSPTSPSSSPTRSTACRCR